MRNTTRVARYLICLVPAAVAFSYGAASMTLNPESKLWVEGTSTVRSWSCKATAIDAIVESTSPQAVAEVLMAEKAVGAVQVKIPAAKLDCANGTMNGHMMKALKVKESPIIAFSVTSYDVAKAARGVEGTINGQLSLGGVTKPIAIKAVGVEGENGTLRVTGSYELKMTDYGIKPPTLMLGTMKVGEKVTVKFDLNLKG